MLDHGLEILSLSTAAALTYVEEKTGKDPRSQFMDLVVKSRLSGGRLKFDDLALAFLTEAVVRRPEKDVFAEVNALVESWSADKRPAYTSAQWVHLYLFGLRYDLSPAQVHELCVRVASMSTGKVEFGRLLTVLGAAMQKRYQDVLMPVGAESKDILSDAQLLEFVVIPNFRAVLPLQDARG